MQFCFGVHTLNTDAYELRQSGQPVPLQPKVFELLAYLAQHRDRVVARQELLDALWPDQFVSDDALERAIAAVRKAVGDNGRAQRVIKTVYGRGYHFISPVKEGLGAVEAPATGSPTISPRALDEPGCADTSADIAAESGTDVAERKTVTLLAAGLAPDEAQTATWDAEALYALRRRFFTLAQREVERYGGVIQYVDENDFVAFFGALLAAEDHAQRGLMTALSLQERLRDPWDDLELDPENACVARMSLHAGPMVISCIGEGQGRIVMAWGDAMQVARRLMALAAPGEVWLSDAALRLAPGPIRAEPVQAACRDASGAVVAAHRALGWERPGALTAWQGRRALHPLVGRARQMATLQDAWSQVLERRGQVVGVTGEAGIGKSRLLYEFRQRLQEQPLTYLAARCLSYGAATPYLPLLDLVRQACGLTPSDAPDAVALKVCETLLKLDMDGHEWTPYLLNLLGRQESLNDLAASNLETLRSRSFEVLIQLFQRQSQQRALILEIEDLHWIDPTSEAWLLTLVERLAGMPILLLTSYRPGYQPPWMDKGYATQVALQRLTPRESWRALQHLLAHTQTPPALVQDVIAKADGNPFFLEELALTVVEQGASQCLSGIPETIEAVLTARMDRLPPEAKRVLQLAAVVGRDLPIDLLQRLASLPEAAMSQTLAQLRMADLLYETRPAPEQIYSFKHALAQEAAYGAMLPSDRRQAHEHLAHLLVDAFPHLVATHPERLAHHFTEAALPAQALPYWRQAGERAFAHAAHMEALDHLGKGLALLPTLPDTPDHIQAELDLQLALGRALIHARGHASPEVQRAFIRARELCQQGGTPQQQLLALSGLRDCHIVRAELHAAQGLAAQCLSLASHAPDACVRSGAHSSHGGLLFCLGEFAAARDSLEQGIAHYQGPRSHRAQTLRMGADTGVTCRAWASLTLWALGDVEQAWQRSGEALTLAQNLSHPYSVAFALAVAAFLHYCCREAAATQERAEALLALISELETQYHRPMALAFQGWAIVMQNQEEAAIDLIEQGLNACRSLGGRQWLPLHLMLLAEGHAALGQVETACHALTEAQAVVEQTGVRFCEAELSRLQGETLLALSSDHRPQAEVCFQRALQIARQQQARSLELRATISLCRLYQHLDKRDIARQQLTDVLGSFTEGSDTPLLQEAEALLQILG